MADRFRRLQVLSAGVHGLRPRLERRPEDDGHHHPRPLLGRRHPGRSTVPTWVIVVSATALSLGTAVGGWRIMKTMGQRVVKLEPVHGFAAETTAAIDPLRRRRTSGCRSRRPTSSRARSWASASSQGARGVRWGVARRILVAWVLTIPAAGILAALAWVVLNALGLHDLIDHDAAAATDPEGSR